MRIVSGNLKGIRFKAPKGFPSRPTTDFAKEALFNILANNYFFDEIAVLDLFSGTGSISYEFASRGVKQVTAIDKNYKCVSFIQKKIKELKLEHLRVLKSDAIQFLNKNEETFDLIFADPPFSLAIHEEIVNLIFEKDLLIEEGVLIIEHGRETNLKSIPQYIETKNYGGVQFSFFKKK